MAVTHIITMPTDLIGVQRLAQVPLEGVEVWCVDLAQPQPDAAVEALDTRECERLRRFRFERDRRRYLHSHFALRCLLGRQLGIPPGRVAFVLSPREKPGLAPHLPPLSFNMSHDDRFALIAIGEVGLEIGIDIESADRQDREALIDIASGCFSAAELAALRAEAGDAGLRRAFLRGWTRKEACLKALGTGLSVEPASFHAGLEPMSARVSIAVDRTIQSTNVASFDREALAELEREAGTLIEAAIAWATPVHGSA